MGTTQKSFSYCWCPQVTQPQPSLPCFDGPSNLLTLQPPSCLTWSLCATLCSPKVKIQNKITGMLDHQNPSTELKSHWLHFFSSIVLFQTATCSPKTLGLNSVNFGFVYTNREIWKWKRTLGNTETRRGIKLESRGQGNLPP